MTTVVRFTVLTLILVSLSPLNSFAQTVRIELGAEYKTYSYNRKKVTDPDGLTLSLVQQIQSESGAAQSIALLDFSMENDAAVKARNIITQAVDQALSSRAYAALTDVEKSDLIFKPLRERLRSSPGILHVDHHYPLPSLAATSTTVLLSEFLNWLHTEGEVALLDTLSRGIGVMDHSDADIVLAHFLMRHARDGELLKTHGKLLAGTALYNDYIQEPAGSVRTRAEVRSFFNILQTLDEEIADGTISIGQAHSEVLDAIRLVERLRRELPNEETDLELALVKLIQNRDRSYSPSEERVLELFLTGYQTYAQDVTALASLERESLTAKNAGTFEVAPNQIPVDSIRKSGPVLVAFLSEATPLHELSVFKRFLESKDSSLLDGVTYLIASVVNPITGARFMKIRTLLGRGSIDPYYPRLKAAGFEAGGRSAAGATAYGKAGKQGLSVADAAQDLTRVIEILSSCNEALL